MRQIYIKSKAMLHIGRRRENLATQVIYEGYPEDGYSVQVFVKRNGDMAAYPASNVVLDDTDRVIRWNVTATDTDKQGTGEVQFRYSNSDGVVVKTEIYSFIVTAAIDADAGPAPDPYESWLESLTDLAEQVQTDAERAEDAVAEIQGITADATTLPTGSEATASYSEGVLRFGIPTGPQGERGATGAQGDSFANMWPWYKRATTASEAKSSGGSWSMIPPSLTSTYRYLGCYWEIRKDNGDGTSLNWTTEPFLLGVYGDKGNKGDTGATGPKGDTGATGPGVPSGGTAGQFLVKSSGTDYDTEWVTLQAWEGGNY